MEQKLHLLIIIAFLSFSLFSAVNAIDGLAVYYDPDYYSPAPACGYPRSTGVFVAGVRDNLWDGGRACGRTYRVRCTGGIGQAPYPCKPGWVTVKVIDYCRSVCNGDINLSRDAFNKIADPKAGKIHIDYQRIS
ncbi:hypothetical protein MLD38_014507 [Melastoma candidum]|uniref:Uncharacterized protein n=1 Tax=Melastoma candidum TaxID=119954 RepID=A0ACB9RGR0_9MYRT|nr:hypothetical protein MLD38_014507 [Melastoma candidum]